MPRGGRREGAGPKPIGLSVEENLWVWASFHTTKQRLTQRKHDREERQYLSKSESLKTLRTTIDKLRQWSKTSDPEEARVHSLQYARRWRRTSNAKDLFDDMRDAVRIFRTENAKRKGCDVSDPNWERVIPEWIAATYDLPNSRLYNRRQQILELTALRATRAFCKPISANCVREIVESFPDPSEIGVFD